MGFATLYALLAAIATGCNIGAQELLVRLYDGPYSLLLALLLGTAVGLLVKYALDKRYIFDFRARSVAHDGQTFVRYAATGLITTGVFWGFELAFEHAFASKAMRYLGGIIGLSLGYAAKYTLDKRFVFAGAPL